MDLKTPRSEARTALNSVARFAPAVTKSPIECERYYTTRHTVWARQMLRAHDGFASYATARAIARLGEAGFDQPPTRWRYVLLGRRPGADGGFDRQTEEFIAEDHRNFLQDWHGYTTEQTVLLDRRQGHPNGSAYLAEISARAGNRAPASRNALDGLTAALTAAGDRSPAVRFIAVDRVVAAMGADAIDLPGQRPVRLPLAYSDVVAFVLILADRHDATGHWFLDQQPFLSSGSSALDVLVHHVDLAISIPSL